MAFTDTQTALLLERARGNDASAIDELLRGHRDRLKRAVAVRIDSRLSGRVDPSDIVQDTLLEASQKLPAYLQKPAIPFYPWLRAIAMERLVRSYREHIVAQKRSVLREEIVFPGLSDDSRLELSDRIAEPGLRPDDKLSAQEMRLQMNAALDKLNVQQREILILKYLENMSPGEIAAALGITDRSVRRRHRQAIQSLAGLLRANAGESL
jgi:RNA polymerase sigma-70 factor (ECF subfamily)